MPKIYDLKDKKEYLKEVATLEYNEWANNKEEDYQARIERKIAKINSLFSEKNFVKLILLNSEELIGFVSMFPNDCEEYKELTPWYATIYIKKNYRNKGYSKVLTKAILEKAKTMNIKQLYLKTKLKGYYEKLGAKYYKNLNEEENIYYFDTE